MRAWALLGAIVVACADPPPPVVPRGDPDPIVAPPAETDPTGPPPPGAVEPADAGVALLVDAGPPAAPPPPSTASFEEATAKPEPVGLNDDRPQLTDAQLQAPMRGALGSCKVPAKAKVTVKTAVQNGRAIGVTVTVDLPAPKQPKKPTAQSKKAAKAHAQTVARVTACADKAVRALAWPPSRRRDAVTTTF